MKTLGYQIDKKQVSQMIDFLDDTNKGIITKDAFIKFMTARMVQNALLQDFRDEQEELRQGFEFYDQLGKGIIRLNDLERVAEELGE